MSQPLTTAALHSLDLAGQLLAKGQCPWCDGTGMITHERCDSCLNGQIDGATCAACHGNPIFPVPPTPCPNCTLSQ